MEQVIVVDKNDIQQGIMDKMMAHREGVLHRAVSGFVINDKKELLLQQRALSKYHTPGIWSNTVCSHPRDNEDVLSAVTRRLKEEMGMSAVFHEIGTLLYRAEFDNDLIEHEYDHVFVASYENQIIKPNPEEVSDYKWMNRFELEEAIEQHPKEFSPWMQLIIQQDFIKEYF